MIVEFSRFTVIYGRAFSEYLIDLLLGLKMKHLRLFRHGLNGVVLTCTNNEESGNI